MENGRFTQEEQVYLLSLSAVEAIADDRIIVYSLTFKKNCLKRYFAGDRPAQIFADAGLPKELVGYKRIERSFSRWKESLSKGCLSELSYKGGKAQRLQNRLEDKDAKLALAARRLADADKQKRETKKNCSKRLQSQKQDLLSRKRAAVERQRKIRERDVAKLEAKLAKQKKRAMTREQQIIASQAAEIASLKDQVAALKALGTLAHKSQRAPYQTKKTERFELIAALRKTNPSLNISAVCRALEVSRRGFYDWLDASNLRAQREHEDLISKSIIEQAFISHGFKKGSRLIVDNLKRELGLVMNRKKVQRIMRKFGIVYRRKRKNPYHPIGLDGLPKVAPNSVNRNFRQGSAGKVLSTDITYLPTCEGFSYLSAVIDCETNVVLAHQVSQSLEEKFVLDTFDKLKDAQLSADVVACSDQGIHYLAKSYRTKLKELGVVQSMSRRACCWDNAPIESFWGRMKEQIGPTNKMEPSAVAELVNRYIEYYNYHRGQARLGWLTPMEYSAQLSS